jgi:Ca2+-binding RTX toxin-like protein
MTARRSHLSLTILLVWAWTGRAEAQTAPTCSFDPVAAAVTVSVNGQDAHLGVDRVTGAIRLELVPCGDATVFNTNIIQVNGGALSDNVFLSGSFAPGLTPEADGASEIEISFALGDGYDDAVFNLTRGRDVFTFTSDGVDVGNDLDRDILTAGVESIEVYGREGNDRIDASAYTSRPPAYGGIILLHGGSGQDTLIGSPILGNYLHGNDDADRLYGGDLGDSLYGGTGDDLLVGDGGGDVFYSDAVADGADDMRGGAGFDRVSYRSRVNDVTVTLDNAADDGEIGEGDNVRADVEWVMGGRGSDVLVGNGFANRLYGYGGNDELYGEGGNDVLSGGFEADYLYCGPGVDDDFDSDPSDLVVDQCEL